MLQLEITIVPETYDEEKEEFIDPLITVLSLEHSLVSLSKWESKWCKPFLTREEKTPEETLDYIKCMTLDTNVNPLVYDLLTSYHMEQIKKYIEAPMTATWFSDDKNKSRASREQVTSELIYYWMVALTIPFECQYWHLNRLLTLVKVCNAKNQPPKKMSKREIMSQNAAVNAARRKQFNTRG